MLIGRNGLPELPTITFWSGDVLFLVRDIDIIKYGKKYKLLFMIPTEKTMWRYDIKEEELDYRFTSSGALIREYPAGHFHWLSTTPENQSILITCSFDGTERLDHDISEISAKLVRQDNIMRNLMNENENLREQLKVASEKLIALERKFK